MYSAVISILLCSSFAFWEGEIKASPAPSNSIEARSAVIAIRFDSLFSELLEHKGFNGNVLVGIHGNVIYKNSFGYSNMKTKKPLNVKSVFQIASVTKQFTAAAVMMMHDSGLIDYNEAVQHYIPDFPYKNITIRQLLSHRSGLPNYMYFAGKYWKKKRVYLTNDDLLGIMKKYKPRLEFQPDQRYKYSNTGYAVLAIIVERVSGKPYHQFMEESIFFPLGMRSTFVYDPKNKKTIEYETNGYTKRKRKTYPDFLDGVIGDKGIYSTVEDLFRWDQALYTEKLIKQSTLNEAFTPMSYDPRRDNMYGFGWRIDTADDGSKVVYHGGWWRGYSSLFIRRLEDHATIIILCNRVNWSWGEKEDLMHIIDSTMF